MNGRIISGNKIDKTVATVISGTAMPAREICVTSLKLGILNIKVTVTVHFITN